MRIIISAIVIIILIFFLILLLRSNYITETFVNVKDLPDLKDYQGDKLTSKDLEDIMNYTGKVSDKYDTIDDPISDSLIPYNPDDKIKSTDYDIIDIFKKILERPPSVNEITKFSYYSNDKIKEYLFNSPEYDKLIKTQNNTVNNGIEGAIARKNIINRITDIYATIYTDELNVKMMLPLRDCFIYLQMNEYLFAAFLESYNYKKFEVDVLSTYVLTKKVLLQLFKKHFNVLELKLLAQDKINNIKNQNNIFSKEIDSIKKDLLSLSSVVNPQNVIGTIKINFPSVYNELIKATLKSGENIDSSSFDFSKIGSFLTNIEKYQNNGNNNDNDNDDNNNDDDNTYRSTTYYNPIDDAYTTPTDTPTPEPPPSLEPTPPIPEPTLPTPPPTPEPTPTPTPTPTPEPTPTPPPPTPEPTPTEKILLASTKPVIKKTITIENLKMNKDLTKDIEKLPDNAELYTRVYNPLPRNSSYAYMPNGYKPPICNNLGKEQLTQPVFTSSKLLFQGTDFDTAFKDTQVGSIMPKFFYQEYNDVKIN